MTIRSMTVLAAVALGSSAAVSGQNKVDRAFNATGASCDQITWSKESRAKYPQIGAACRDVIQRYGKYFAKLEGEVRRVANDGQRLTVSFKDGNRMTLAPPPNMSLYVDNRLIPIRALQPGDDLSFYIPEDRFTAAFFRADTAGSTSQEVPIGASRVAMTSPPSKAAASSAAVLPALSVAEVVLMMWPRH